MYNLIDNVSATPLQTYHGDDRHEAETDNTKVFGIFMADNGFAIFLDFPVYIDCRISWLSGFVLLFAHFSIFKLGIDGTETANNDCMHCY